MGVLPQRDADQDQVGLVVVVGAGAVVVVEGEVHRLDAIHVVGVVADGVGLADRIGRVGRKLLFQRRKKGGEDIDHETVGLRQDRPDVAVHDGIEDDRAGPVRLGSIIDLLYHGARFFFGIDVRSRQFDEADVLELCQKALAQGFGGDTGAVRDEECGSFHLHRKP